MPGLHLAGGTSFTSPEMSKEATAATATSTARSTTSNCARWGIQLVDGRMPGFAAIVGCAKIERGGGQDRPRAAAAQHPDLPVRQRQWPQHHPPVAGRRRGDGLRYLHRALRHSTPSRAIYAAGLCHPLRADLRRHEGRAGARDPALQQGARVCLRAGAGRGGRPEVRHRRRRDQLRLPGHRRHRHPANPADRRHHLRARHLDAVQRDRGQG